MATNKDILDQIKEDSQSFPPGILPSGKTMDSLIGHTVINISGTPRYSTNRGSAERANILSNPRSPH